MKKLLTIGLTLILAVAMCVSAFAATGGFVSSPSGKSAPELVKYSAENNDCKAKLVITSYSDRDTLPDDVREKLEKAYNTIIANTDITKLNSAIAELATKKNIPASDLAVSDLFDISYYNCEDHEDHGYFDITFKAETLNNFVGLLHFNGEKWELITNAKVEGNGEHLTFTVDDLSPFAIVVNTGADNSDTPQTGDNTNTIICVIVMVVCAVAIIVLWRRSKKNNA